MDRDQLIAKQQLEIENLKGRVYEMNNVLRDIKLTLVCIGGPLNDNKLMYSKEQRKPLHEINRMIEDILEPQS